MAQKPEIPKPTRPSVIEPLKSGATHGVRPAPSPRPPGPKGK